MNKKHQDKCSNCETTKSKKFHDFEDYSVLCDDCYEEIGKEWKKKVKEKINQKNNVDNNNSLKGVGGWLVFYIVSQVIGIFIILGLLLGSFVGGYNPVDKIVVPVYILLSFIWTILNIYYLIKEKNDTKSFTLKNLYSGLIDYIITFILAFALYSNFPFAVEEYFYLQLGLLFRFGIALLIWITYFHKSIRVKNTYKVTNNSFLYKLGNIFFIISVSISVIGGIASMFYDINYYSDVEKLNPINTQMEVLDYKWNINNCEYETYASTTCDNIAEEYNILLDEYNLKYDEIKKKYPYYFLDIE